MKVMVHKPAIYACPNKHDEAAVVMALKPAQPIEKGLPTASLLAGIRRFVGASVLPHDRAEARTSQQCGFGDHLPSKRLDEICCWHRAAYPSGSSRKPAMPVGRI